jgi:hypothetical protein
MAALTRTSKAHLTAQRVSRDLEEAIANYELFSPSGTNRDIINRVNARKINGGFNVISASLHHIVVVTLCRIWDKRRDVASLYTIETLLTKSEYQNERATIVKHLGHEARFSFDKRRFADWVKKIDIASRDESLAAIKATRDNWLAHSASPDSEYRGTARAEVYGDERKVIEMTIPFVKEINSIIGYEFLDFASLRNKWADEAVVFWYAVAS